MHNVPPRYLSCIYLSGQTQQEVWLDKLLVLSIQIIYFLGDNDYILLSSPRSKSSCVFITDNSHLSKFP